MAYEFTESTQSCLEIHKEKLLAERQGNYQNWNIQSDFFLDRQSIC
jgi:hypothetical protein